jgi:anti-sigma factor RsiW
VNRHCDRARAAISFEVDGELSELELAVLRRHLRQCERCVSFRADTMAFSEMLRAAPLEEYSVGFSPISVRHWPHRLRRVVPAVAAVVLFIGMGSTLSRVVSQPDPVVPPPAPTGIRNLSSPPVSSGTFASALKVVPPPLTRSPFLGRRSASEDF